MRASPYEPLHLSGAILLLLSVLFGGIGCSVSEPPEPTIVPAKSAAAQSSSLPTPTLMAATENAPTETPVAAEEPAPSPAPVETSAATELPPLDTLDLNLAPVAGGFTKPTFITHAGDGTGRLFVVEQAGRILILKDGAVNPTPFLDIVSLVGSDASERGLLSLAFHPNYPENGLLFVDYTDKRGDTVIARYQVSEDPDRVDPDSATVLLTFSQPYANHNGGQLAFDPEGYLFIGAGDGGSANDPQNNGQSLDTLLGKMLRIDVDSGDPYGVPDNNPFIDNADARPEIWSYGWRNPWRFSFDHLTGDLYIADVGQNQYEEVSVELAGTPGGQNYGWRLMEGRHCFDPPECDPAAQGLVLPVVEYDHSQGCSVTGGYVYRGVRFPELTGVYLYGDFCSGILWGLRREANGNWSQAQLLQTNYAISSFGQDEAGELYLVHHGGEIFQVVAE